MADGERGGTFDRKRSEGIRVARNALLRLAPAQFIARLTLILNRGRPYLTRPQSMALTHEILRIRLILPLAPQGEKDQRKSVSFPVK